MPSISNARSRHLAVAGLMTAGVLALSSQARAECEMPWAIIDDDTCALRVPLGTTSDPASASCEENIPIDSYVRVTRVKVNGTTGRRFMGTEVRDRMQATSDFARQYDCSVAVNGAFFSTNGSTHSRVVANRVVWGAASDLTTDIDSNAYAAGYFVADIVQQTQNGVSSTKNTVRTWSQGENTEPVTFAIDAKTPSKPFMAVSGPHLLVKGGRRLVFPSSCIEGVTSNTEFNRAQKGECGRTSRTAIGVNADRSYVYFVAIDGSGARISDVSRFMSEVLKVDWALNLDGGGSTSMVLAGGVFDDSFEPLTTPRDHYPDRDGPEGLVQERAVAFNFGFCRTRAATATFFAKPSIWYRSTTNLVTTFTYKGEWEARHLRTLGDVNGDGFLDIVGFHDHDVFVVDGNEHVTPLTVAIPGDSVPTRKTRTSFAEDPAAHPFWYKWSKEFTTDANWSLDSSARFAVPVNDDRAADVLAVDATGHIWTALSNGKKGFEGGGFDPAQRYEPINGYTLCGILDPVSGDSTRCWDKRKNAIEAADMNADGRTDLVVFGKDGTYVVYNRGCWWGYQCIFDKPVQLHGSFGTTSGWRSSNHVRALADVDGDAHPDIVGFGNSAVLVAKCSWASSDPASSSGPGTCSYPGVPKAWLDTSFTYNSGWSVDRHDRFVADVTGDRVADIVGIGYQDVLVSVADPKNGRFLPSRVWLPQRFTSQDPNEPDGWDKTRHVRMAADVSGDGLADIVGFGERRIVVSQPR